MNTKPAMILIVLMLIPVAVFSAADQSYRSKYAGEEKRAIKSFSEADIEELENGGGWGLAKAAELNGMPGPAHVLEMKDEIDLSAAQRRSVENLYAKMKQEAIPLGLELIELEKELNSHFANKTITDELLGVLLGRIAQVTQELRYVHLAAHLETLNILNPEQISLYNKLRGYFSDDPCANIPPGHDLEMWKKHNNCM